MTAPTQENQAQENKPSDKELNFRKQEAMYQRQLAEKDAQLAEALKLAQNKQVQKDDDDTDDEPYVDHKKLTKTLNRFGEQTKHQTQQEIQSAVHKALSEERKQNWIKSNPDFYEVLQHADKFAQRDPDLAESILEMPEGFERQKLVYKNIKALGIHKPEQKTPSIQEKVDANRKGPYYQPSGVGTAPYSQSSDYSNAGQKQAYDKMQELKNRLRLG